ncbi:Methionine import ATP-binding protein MetN 2 [subsurface metagenome]
MALLEVTNLTKRFGGLTACDNISFKLEEGEMVGLIGPNGAGKTTLFNSIVGYYNPDNGTVIFKGEDITRLKPFQTNRKGIARTFQIMRIMGDLTVLENVMIGAFCRTSDRERARNEAEEILNLLHMDRESDAYPKELPIATQKRIELARALATKPDLLMLDEVASGLTPTETEEIIGVLRNIHEEKGLTIFLIEHVMEFVMPISKRMLVLDSGKKIAEGKPEEIAQNEEVIEAYLGERYVKSK